MNKEAEKRVPSTKEVPDTKAFRELGRELISVTENMKILDQPDMKSSLEDALRINILLERAQDKIEEACMLATKAAFLLKEYKTEVEPKSVKSPDCDESPVKEDEWEELIRNLKIHLNG